MSCSCSACLEPSPLQSMLLASGMQGSSPSRLPLPRRLFCPEALASLAASSLPSSSSFSSPLPSSASFPASTPFEVAPPDSYFEDDFTDSEVVSVADRALDAARRAAASAAADAARASVAAVRAREAAAGERERRRREERREEQREGGEGEPGETGAGQGGRWRAGAEERRMSGAEAERRVGRETAMAQEAIRRMMEQAAEAKERENERVRREAERVKEEKNRLIAEEKARQKAKEDAAKPAVAAAAPASNSFTSSVVPSFTPSTATSSSSLAPKTASGELLASLRALADSFPKDKTVLLFKLKAPVTKALNQVTSDPKVTLSRARDIATALGQARELSPDVFKIVMLHFATQVCGMVLTKMGNKISNVFPYAAVTAFVCHSFGECWAVLTASLQDKCPYLIPHFEPRRAGESEAAFKERIGCANESNYMREQNGFVTFYCAVCCAQVSPQGDWRTIMPRMSELWRLLSAILNRKPGFMAPDIVTAVLEVAGTELLLVYKKQAQKLLHFAHTVYLPLCKRESVDGIVEAPLVQRLQTLLDQCSRRQYAYVPEVDPKMVPGFEQTRKMFRMKQIQ